MRHIAALVLIVCGLCGSSMCQYTAVFSSYHGDMRYDFRITRGQLAKTPAWLGDEPNPPLAARRALAIAEGYLQKLFADAEEKRRIVTIPTIALVPVGDRWVYTIEFAEPPRNGCMDCFSAPFKVVVLMDGSVVPATVSPSKPDASTH